MASQRAYSDPFYTSDFRSGGQVGVRGLTNRTNFKTGRLATFPQFTESQRMAVPADSGGQAVGDVAGGSLDGGGLGGGIDSAARAAELRDEILSRRSRANAIFDALTETVNEIAKERTGQLNQDYARQIGDITSASEEKAMELDNAYGARGLSSSSYKTNALTRAAREAQSGMAELGSARRGALAKIGEFLSSTLGRLSSSKASINDLNLDEIGDDVDSLASLRNKLDDRIRALQAQQAGTRTERGFLGQLGRAVPNLGDVAGPVKSALDGLLKAAIPSSVKQALASGIINSYADPDDRLLWQQYFNKQSQQVEEAPQVAQGA